MSRLPAYPFLRDARHYQIAALATLLVFNFGWIDFGAWPLNSACAVAAALLTQIMCSRWWRLPALDLRSPLITGLPALDLRSPLITGLSLSLLLRADDPWLHALAA